MPGLVQDSRIDGGAVTEPCGRERVASASAWVVAAWSNPLRVKTTFGISFIGAAIGSVERGQWAAMSRKVRLPMMWTPACHRVSRVQDIALASKLLNIQSISPFGPPTKPSTDMFCLRISFLIAPPPPVAPTRDDERGRTWPTSHRAAVELDHRQCGHIDPLQAAHVDIGRAFALLAGVLGIRMHAAGLAKPMGDGAGVEGVAADARAGPQQAQLVARQRPQQRALARADRAVAGDQLGQLALDLECHVAAMAAAFVEHAISPYALITIASPESHRRSGRRRFHSSRMAAPTSTSVPARPTEQNKVIASAEGRPTALPEITSERSTMRASAG